MEDILKKSNIINGLFITFEGIDGSGKSSQIIKLKKKLLSYNIKKVVFTREPGGTRGAESIRKLILIDYFNNKKKEKFDKYTDTLLYLAARNEHISKKIKPAFNQKKIIICDRFIDSTIAYQVYGKGVKKNLIDNIHKHILNGIKPNLTFILKVNISKALKRLNKRKKKNRYDKFSKTFYINAQKSFIKIAKKNKRKYYIFDNSYDNNNIEKKITNIVFSKLK